MVRARDAKTIAVFSVLAVAMTSLVEALAQQKDAPSADSALVVTYTRTGQVETTITIVGAELTRAVTTCHNSGMGQTCENPTTESGKTKLKTDDIEKLKGGIRKSGFLELQDTYGTHNFSYPKTITIKLDGVTKSVVYRAGSNASPPPDAFVSVGKMIETLASKVLPSDLAKTPSQHRDPEK